MAQRISEPRNGLIFPRGLRKPVKPVLDQTHPLSRGLVGCWLLGDTPGPVRDASPNNISGTYNNAPTATPSHHGGMATQFNGSNLAVMSVSPALNLPNAFTVGCWARVTGGTGSFRSIVSKHDGSGGDQRNYDLAARLGNVWGTYCTQGPSNFKGFDGSIPIVTNAWTFVVTTYDGATLRLFVDGVADGTLSVTGAMDVVPAALAIGAIDFTGSEGFTGGIEGVRIYNRGLSVSEILAWKAEPYAGIYSAGIPYLVGVSSSNVTVALTGISGTGSLGTLGKTISVPLTGTTATGSLGSLSVSASKALTGISATGSIGSLGLFFNLPLTGVSGTGSLGTLTPSLATFVALTGNAATGALGTLGVTLTKALTGTSATGSVGSLSVSRSNALTGNAATGSVGTLGVVFNRALSGILGTGAVGTVTPSSAITVALTGISATGSVGTLGKSLNVPLTGNSATGSLGSLTAAGGAVFVGVIGVQAVGYIGNVLVWGAVPDGQTPGWVPITSTQVPTWQPVDDSETTIWTEIPT